MNGIDFLRKRFGVEKGKTLDETIGSHLNIHTVVQELDAFRKQEIGDFKLKVIGKITREK